MTLTNLLDPTFEVLAVPMTPAELLAFSATYDTTTDPAKGVLTITATAVGGEPPAAFAALLRKVTYQNTDTDPDDTPRVIEVVAHDGTDSSSPAAVSTFTIVNVDTAPTAVDDPATVAEDASATAIDVLANDTDPDGGDQFIASATQPTNGTVVLTGGTPGAHTGLTYQPDAEYCNSVSGIPDTFTYTLTPGGDTATVSVTVTCVDDAPVAVADAATLTEDAAATAIPVLANDTDADAGR